MHPLLKIIDVATLLATTPGAARKWLDRKGVPVIDLGVGRGLGLRWARADVEEAILSIVKTAQSAKNKKSKFKPAALISGRTTAEIMADLTSSSPPQ